MYILGLTMMIWRNIPLRVPRILWDCSFSDQTRSFSARRGFPELPRSAAKRRLLLQGFY